MGEAGAKVGTVWIVTNVGTRKRKMRRANSKSKAANILHIVSSWRYR